MLVPAVFFWQVVLAVHIIVVVAAFGVLVAYPLIAIAAERVDRRSVPVLHRVRVVIARTLVNPGLLVVLLAGIYLAAKLHQWHQFYVQWGIAVIVVLGALEGSFVIRQSKKLAKLSEADIAAAPVGSASAGGAAAGEAAAGGAAAGGQWSAEYLRARTRADLVNAVMAVLVIVTVFLMVVQ